MRTLSRYGGQPIDASECRSPGSNASASISAEARGRQTYYEDQEFRELNGINLASFLLEPMQRITRYPILIRAILHRTDTSHPDHADLMAALETAETWAARINDAVRQQEDSQQLQQLQK